MTGFEIASHSLLPSVPQASNNVAIIALRDESSSKTKRLAQSYATTFDIGFYNAIAIAGGVKSRIAFNLTNFHIVAVPQELF